MQQKIVANYLKQITNGYFYTAKSYSSTRASRSAQSTPGVNHCPLIRPIFPYHDSVIWYSSQPFGPQQAWRFLKLSSHTLVALRVLIQISYEIGITSSIQAILNPSRTSAGRGVSQPKKTGLGQLSHRTGTYTIQDRASRNSECLSQGKYNSVLLLHYTYILSRVKSPFSLRNRFIESVCKSKLPINSST